MNYNVTVNGKVYSVTVEKTGAAAPAAVAPVAAPWLPLLSPPRARCCSRPRRRSGARCCSRRCGRR